MHPWLLENVFLPAGDHLFGHQMMRRLRFLEQAQWWSREQLHEERNRLAAQVVRTAYHEVPFYRDLMDRARLRPEQIRTVADLQHLPVVSKAMLAQAYPHRTCRAVKGRTFEAATSGSTGANFRVRKDAETAGWYRASFLLALRWSGWQIGERHLQTGMTLERNLEKRLKDIFLRCHYCSASDLSDARLDRMLDMIEREKIQHLWGYPGSLYFLARRAAQRGWNTPVKGLVTWGDNLHPHYRSTIESAFGVKVFDTYGCSEGFQIAAQCGCENTYHIHSLDVALDYLDDKGNPVPTGRPGNLIVTRLHAGPMPLIRYQVGDVAVAREGQCACGRGYDLLQAIQGRSTDVIVTPEGNRLVVHFFTATLEHFPEIDSFQVIQESADELVLKVVGTTSFNAETPERIRRVLTERGLTGMQIEIEPVSEIPLTAGGKRRFVINRYLQARDEHLKNV